MKREGREMTGQRVERKRGEGSEGPEDGDGGRGREV